MFSFAEQVRRTWAAYAILAVSMLATSLVYWRERQEVLRHQQVHFDQLVEATSRSMELYFTYYLNILTGVRGLFDVRDWVVPDEFRQYLASINLRSDHPGMLDVGYARCVSAAEQEAHIRKVRNMGFSGYNPPFAPGRTNYCPVVYLEDFHNPEVRSSGWDALSDGQRRAAMDVARDTGDPTASGKVPLFTVDGRNQPIGFVLYVPHYRNGRSPATVEERRADLAGFVFGSFISNEVWTHIMGVSGEALLNVEVFDGESPDPAKLLFSGSGAGPGAIHHPSGRPPRLVHSKMLAGLEHAWTLRFTSLPALEAGPEMNLPVFVLLGGLGISFGLFGLALSQSRARHRAEDFAATIRVSNRALADEKERLAVTLRSIGDGVITTDTRGQIVLLNEMAEELTGCGQSEAAGLPSGSVFTLVDPATNQPLESPIDLTLRGGEIIQHAKPARLIPRQGDHHLIAYTAAPIRHSQGEIIGAVLVVRDVTERLKLEEERVKSGKLESIGVLAGGIAHDFNNILTTIIGNISLAALDLPASSEPRQALGLAETACWRARDLTQQLLTFAKGGAPVRRAARLQELIQDSARFATPGSNVRCEFTLPDDLWPIEADKGQISQVIHNLVLNSEQAMPGGGTIEIRAENLHTPEGNALGLPAGRYVRIGVQDHGLGIPPEHLSKIFDPYFTTKQRGSGLGLATAYSIIKRHDGLISVESQLGKGTRFDIYLPATDKAPQVAVGSGAPTALGRGTILVMDDEPMIRRTVQSALKRLGYDVLLANDGAEAVSIFSQRQARSEPVDAVILDLTVPGGMGGLEAFGHLRKLDARVKAIVSSGYSNDPVMSDYQAYGFCGVAAKPYTAEALGRAIEAVLAVGR